MGIVLSKNLKQKQSIKLTPLLKKSIDLLQLSRFELIKKIENEIIENPFLEKQEYDYDNSFNEKDFNFDIESKLTLRETLLDQLNDFDLSNRDTQISQVIIDCIDESGMLTESISKIEEISNFIFSESEIELVLKDIIHRLHPSGVGFRNYKECISIQIKNSSIPENLKILVNKILLNKDLDNLEEIKTKLVKEGSKHQDIVKAINEIKNCDLSPGLNYEKTQYIETDLKLFLKNDEIKVEFIEDGFPIIKTDDDLINQVKQELKTKKNKELLAKINEAKWLLRSVKKRNETVQKVGQYICLKQISFFDENPLKINTLTNKEIADEIGVHPSTVSRILRHKYIETPKGVMPLKSLLISSVSKTRNISSLQLMKLIEDVIKTEKKPKSDKKIAIELNKRGFGLARRTITKYRKKNNIPSSRHR
tara:strand:+ start:2396 stop:3661 length:1266 start_codon:yes stop_codon:yes gene_type:complete